MSYIIVVARYNEDVEWTKHFSNVFIYNKGEKLKSEYKNEVLMKNNIGREGHTYYSYIYDNYDNLPDYIVFLQGRPYDHSPNLNNNLQKYINNGFKSNFEFLSESIIKCNLNGCHHHPGLPLKNVYENIFGERKETLDFHFGAGAQFFVSKENILNKTKEFYKKIIELLDYDINPIEGYVIERFHKLILT